MMFIIIALYLTIGVIAGIGMMITTVNGMKTADKQIDYFRSEGYSDLATMMEASRPNPKISDYVKGIVATVLVWPYFLIVGGYTTVRAMIEVNRFRKGL